ncbi:histidine phosphatase family protein [Paenibacillus sp. MMS20-IR301]|uniref:histidine phosphatase family protein n=1 Tax=Paenibacillus sp. MMS20-IR301 TaxID=2895946 RepID=UPI0028E75DC1|nr:histidine phosphatase family protein [Paenibacillus sp. MMS20-IR301]WNS41796.1 histidine phosphatase family protein [Paenibacillus sp. MMS20-IR301]
MNTTTVYITRHGQTEWNVLKRMQGHQDSELTPLGVQQAQWLGRSMHNVKLDAVYASSSARALRTAELIRGERDLPLTACDEFKEIGMGIWEGRDSAELQLEYPEQHQFFWGDPEQFRVEGSESFTEVQERALRRLQEIIGRHAGGTVLIVTHTVVIKVLMAHFEGRAMNKLWDLPYIHPTCLCRIDITDGVPAIVLHGDISHYETSESGMD